MCYTTNYGRVVQFKNERVNIMKKKVEEPIKIVTYEDLKDIIGYHPCQEITFICEKCNKIVTKSLAAVRKRGLLCQKCQRDLNGIKKYGSEEKFKQHLQDVRVKSLNTLIEKYGSIDEAYKHRVDAYKKTCLEKYGVDNSSKRQEFKDYLKLNNPIFKDEYKEKAKQSYTREKHIAAARKVSEYMKENDLYKINAKKCAETKLARYGNSAYTNHEQSEVTMLSKYGVKSGLNIAIQKRIKQIADDGYVTIGELSETYGYYPEGIEIILKENKIPIKVYGNWRCALRNSLPTDFEEIIHNHRFSYRSNGEKEMYDFVKSLDETAINNDRTILKPKELDIFVPSKNIAIEFDGLFWHKDENLLIKTNQCADKGIRLLHFYEDEWEYKKDICKSIISSALGIFEQRVYARKCKIKNLSTDEYNNFLDNNHIQGFINTPIRIGLFYNEELIQCIGIGKSRYSADEFELYRMCTKLNHQVIGGFSKLLKHLCKYYNINILYSYVDRRLFDGNGYKKIGFSILKETKPSYFYFKNLKRENRIKYQKHKLKKILENFDDSLSEIDNMKNNGFALIYDCGTYKMKIVLNEL